MAEVLPIWHPKACIPREEVLTGSLTDAELALRLSTIAKGEAKPPYNTPETFLKATHLTRNMKTILENVFGRLAGTKKEVNPIIVLDVGFGGGKTHTMATLYYIAKHGNERKIAELTGGIQIPNNIKTVVMSGEDYTEEGITRDGKQIKTIWGDMFWQLGKYEQYEKKDREATVPSIDELKEAIKNSPTLILLDELPAYLKAVSPQKNMLDKTVQWIHHLVIAVSEVDKAVLVVAIAEDAYRQEAEKTKTAIAVAVEEAIRESRALIARKETVYVPIDEEDVVHILKRRLFETINTEAAKQAAQAYHELYRDLPVIEELKTATYRDRIEEYYPFHPHLVKVLYERLATLDRFQRTRGALRLLSRTIRRIWAMKEPDATLIHPFHIDLADEDILTDLTTHIGEEKLRNAVEADIWKGDGTATAERLDEQAKAHWGAPLVRRACNTIYLYSLATGKEGDKGIRTDLLVSLMVSPLRRELYFRTRDIVLGLLSDQFHYIDKQGERYVFVKEPTPIRVIDLLARDITEEDIIKLIKEKLQNEYFKRAKGTVEWINVEIFPTSPGRLQDDMPTIQVAILNPNMFTISDRNIPENIKQFIEYSDDHKQRPRRYTNGTFLLVCSEDALQAMKVIARKVVAARNVREDPTRFQIPKDRKTDIEEYLSRHEKLLYDYIRAAYLNLIYYHRDGIRIHQIKDGSGYGSATTGYDIIKHILTKVIERVAEQALDPEYVKEYIWPAGAASVTTKDLHEWFFRIPGVRIPATQDVLIKTIQQGIEQDTWRLYINGQIYDKDNSAKSINIDARTELLTVEEAEKRKIRATHKEPTTTVKQEAKEKPKVELTIPEPIKIWPIYMSDTKAEILASDLEKKVKTEKITSIHKAVIKTNSPEPIVLHELRNIITRYSPERELGLRMVGSISRTRSPRYTVTFDVEKDSAQSEEGKSLLENLLKLKGADAADIKLELTWNTPTKPEELTKILRTLKGDMIISLEAEVARQ